MSWPTPGPWVAVFNGHYWQVEPADRGPEDPWQIGDVCASNPGNPASGLQKANACLIAAAPDLLAACKALIEVAAAHIPEAHGPHPNPAYEPIEKARAAIAAAEPKP